MTDPKNLSDKQKAEYEAWGQGNELFHNCNACVENRAAESQIQYIGMIAPPTFDPASNTASASETFPMLVFRCNFCSHVMLFDAAHLPWMK